MDQNHHPIKLEIGLLKTNFCVNKKMGMGTPLANVAEFP
jgi:hypothetical protein